MFFSLKYAVKMRNQVTDWEKMFTIYFKIIKLRIQNISLEINNNNKNGSIKMGKTLVSMDIQGYKMMFTITNHQKNEN